MQLNGERASHGHLWVQSTMMEKPKEQEFEAARNSTHTQEMENEACIGAPSRAPSLLSAFSTVQDALPRQ